MEIIVYEYEYRICRVRNVYIKILVYEKLLKEYIEKIIYITFYYFSNYCIINMYYFSMKEIK